MRTHKSFLASHICFAIIGIQALVFGALLPVHLLEAEGGTTISGFVRERRAVAEENLGYFPAQLSLSPKSEGGTPVSIGTSGDGAYSFLGVMPGEYTLCLMTSGGALNPNYGIISSSQACKDVTVAEADASLEMKDFTVALRPVVLFGEGEEEVTFDVGDEYTDPAVTATSYDVSLTATSTGLTVDQMNTVGDYEVEYSATDSETGLTGSTVRVVHVREPAATVQIMGRVRLINGNSETDAPFTLGAQIELRPERGSGIIASTTSGASGDWTITATPTTQGQRVYIIIPDGYLMADSAPEYEPVAYDGSNNITIADFRLTRGILMTLNGPELVEIERGGTFTDLGATATKDGQSLLVSTSSDKTLDTNIPDDYVFTYEATDEQSGLSASVSRTVRVLAPPLPIAVSGTVRVGDIASHDNNGMGNVVIELKDGSTKQLLATTITGDGGGWALTGTARSVDACIVVPSGYALIAASSTCLTYAVRDNVYETILDDFTLSPLPTITLRGGASLALAYGATYEEQGATALRGNEDLTSLITITGAVDTRRIGEQVLTYKVIHPQTQLSSEVVRRVTVSGSRGGSVIGGSMLPVQLPPSIQPPTMPIAPPVVERSQQHPRQQNAPRQNPHAAAQSLSRGQVAGAEDTQIATGSPQVNVAAVGTTETPRVFPYFAALATLALAALALFTYRYLPRFSRK